VLAGLLAVGVPAVFLLLIYTLDLYASRTFRLAMLSFAWGAIGAFGLAYLLNTYVGLPLLLQVSSNPYLLLTVAFAPVVEEVAKPLILVYISRRPEFTYFVDGAIYGFAAGIGFSVVENFLYLSTNPGSGIALALARAFSTCLMHGTAAGLVGAAVGRFRFRRRTSRGTAQVAGWLVAVLLHALFNGVVYADLPGSGAVILPIAIGLVGVGSVVGFIMLGLQEERRWLAETLDRGLGVTAAEVRAAQAYGSLEEVLRPIAQQFPRKAEQVERLLLLQAQMGIKRKVRQQTEDPRLRAQLDESIAQLRAEMERLRREVGLYVMSYLRGVFPEGALDIWERMERLATAAGPADVERWTRMLPTTESTADRPGIFARVRQAGEGQPEAGKGPRT